MNYELTEVMVEFRPEHERMLWSLPATGSAFKKVYDDITLGRQTSMFVPAEDVDFALWYDRHGHLLPYDACHAQDQKRNFKATKSGFLSRF